MRDFKELTCKDNINKIQSNFSRNNDSIEEQTNEHEENGARQNTLK